jgi:hypothetical protein
MSFISLCHVRALVALASVCGFGTGISTMGLPLAAAPEIT